MGLYDREYYRDDDAPGVFGGQRPLVTTLIIINVAIFVLDYFSQGRLGDVLALPNNVFTHPWNAWKLLTAGFAHDTHNIAHIFFNMFGLYAFGRPMEEYLGRREFLRLYLLLIVVASLVWAFAASLAIGFNPEQPAKMIGASGAVVGIAVVFACNFPRQVVLLFGVFPLQAWVLVAIWVSLDVFSALQGGAAGTEVAYMAHLGGAGTAYLYYRSRRRISDLIDFESFKRLLSRRPKLKLHREDEQDLNARVDAVLEKISREGEASLTRRERQLLESASRRYQQRRR